MTAVPLVEVPVIVQRLSATEVLLRGPETLRVWREEHRVPVPGHEYTPGFKSGRWDGIWAPGRWCRLAEDGAWEMRCSIGTAQRAIRDLLGDPAVHIPAIAGATLSQFEEFYALEARARDLRDYQLEALRAAIMSGWGRVALATNAGKGAVIGLMATFARRGGLRALVLCDEVSVFDALDGELRAWGRNVPAHVKAGRAEPPTSAVTLAMVPTLARRLEPKLNAEDKACRARWQEWVANVEMVLLDEADKATAPSWRAVIRAAVNAAWRVGFSGTFPTEPYADGLLDELMGPIIARVTNAELVAAGVSARPSVELRGYDATAALRVAWPKRMTGAARRRRAYEHAVVRNDARHAFIASLIRPETPTAVIVNRVEHGHRLLRALDGLNAAFLDGSADEAERRETLERFRNGAVRVLVVTRILDRGTNRLGHAADVIFASSEGSDRQTLQRLGRGLRRAGGKEFLRLVDVIDRVESDGSYALDKAAEYLHAAGQARVRLYAEEGFDTEVIP